MPVLLYLLGFVCGLPLGAAGWALVGRLRRRCGADGSPDGVSVSDDEAFRNILND